MARAFDEDARERFCRLIADGKPFALAAEMTGFKQSTIRSHAKTNPEFAEMLVDARNVADGRVEDRVYAAATSDEQYHHQASTWWLEHRQREQWGQITKHTHEVSGPGGGPIPIASAVMVAVQGALAAPETREQYLDALDAIPATALPSGDD